MSPTLRRKQVLLLVVAGVVVVSGLAAVASPARDQRDAPRQSLTNDTPPTTQVGPAARNVTPPTPEPAWPMARANAANTNSLNTTGPTSPLTTRWEFETGESTVRKGPLVANGTVYFSAGGFHGEKRVYAVDAWTGEKRWQFKLSPGGTGGNWVSALMVFRDTVYVGTKTNKVYALDATTGERFWTFRPDGRATGLTVANRRLYVTSKGTSGGEVPDGHVYALSALTGEKRWQFTTDQPPGGPFRGPPAVKDGTVYVSERYGFLYALNAKTGAKRWHVRVDEEKDRISKPVVANGLVYVSDNAIKDRNTLYVLDAKTGEQQWSYDPVGKVRRPTVANDTLYVGVRSNGLYALDATSGTEQWHVRQFDRSPVVVANTAYVPKGGSLYSLHPANGSERGHFIPKNSKAAIKGQAVLNGSLYLGAKNSGHGLVYAVGTRKFIYTDLSVTPRSPGVNESVTVTATVRNTGTGPGSFNATLRVDGTVTNATTDTLDPRTSRTVTFTHTFQANGTYTVGIGGYTRRIGVGGVTPPPTPTPTATATHATGQTGTEQSAPTTTATPTSSTVPGFGVGVAVAAMAVVTGLLGRRRWT